MKLAQIRMKQHAPKSQDDKIMSIIKREFEPEIDKAKRNASALATKATLAVSAMALHELFGFGGDRLRKLLDRVDIIAEHINAEAMTVTEVIDWCNDEYQLNI